MGNRDSAYKGHTQNLLHSRTQGRSSYLKGTWVRLVRSNLLILETLLKRQEEIEAYPGSILLSAIWGSFFAMRMLVLSCWIRPLDY